MIRAKIIAAAMCLLSIVFFFAREMKTYAYERISAVIPVNCLYVNDDTSLIYEIKIESENKNSPEPVSDVLNVTENGTGYFEINITEPGTFSYKLYEIAGSDPYIQYDESVYVVKVFVENGEDDDLKYSVSAFHIGDEHKLENIEFKNKVLHDSATSTTSYSSTATNTSATMTTTAEITTSAAVSATSDITNNQITGFIDSVFTGDSFPAHAIGLAMMIAVLIAISTFLFRRNNSEEEDENE